MLKFFTKIIQINLVFFSFFFKKFIFKTFSEECGENIGEYLNRFCKEKKNIFSKWVLKIKNKKKRFQDVPEDILKRCDLNFCNRNKSHFSRQKNFFYDSDKVKTIKPV